MLKRFFLKQRVLTTSIVMFFTPLCLFAESEPRPCQAYEERVRLVETAPYSLSKTSKELYLAIKNICENDPNANFKVTQKWGERAIELEDVGYRIRFAGQNWFVRMTQWNLMNRKQKVLAVNTATAGLVVLYGLVDWDYGSAKLQLKKEGWFGEDTKHGGADKLGHMWSTYAYSDLLGGIYRDWGYSPEKP